MELPKTGDVLLEKYRLEKLLGEGGMGVVYAAHHELLGQRVAVKLIRPEFAVHGDATTRFLNEARAAARIENEHVARVLDVGILGGSLPYMVLEHLDGSDLAKVLEQRKQLPVAEVADHLLQTIDAIAHAHALGIVHRDLKPSNLFLARRPDGTSRVKVLDFGISKATGTTGGVAANVTRTNAMLGSPLYMSPEQLRDSKGVDHRCDIWALGVIIYELLTGEPPFNGENAVALFAAIMESEPPSLRERRPDAAALEPIVLRCLRHRTADRFSSVTELGQALAPFGTIVAQRALESAKRILPLPPPSDPALVPASAGMSPRAATLPLHAPDALAARAQHQSSPNLASAAGSGAYPAAPPSIGAARTADPWARSNPGTNAGASTAASTRTAGIIAGGVAVLFVLAGAAIAVPRVMASRHAGTAAASAEPSPSAAAAVAVSPSASTSGTTVASAAPTPSLSASPEVSSSASSAPATAAVAISATPPTKPGSVVAVTPAVKPGVPTKPAASGLPAPATSATAAGKSCTPPYEFDANGKKIWKRECL